MTAKTPRITMVMHVPGETKEMSRALRTFLNDAMQCGDMSCTHPGDDAPLQWRRGSNNTGRSRSDWTVVVYDGALKETYHVHKVQLAYGPRPSGFFAKLFGAALPPAAAAQEDSVSEVYLPPRAAEAFPMLLDYIYSEILLLETSAAPSLRYLAKHFEVRDLFEEVSSFIHKDLTAATAVSYCTEAELVKDLETLNAAVKVCAKNISRISTDEIASLTPRLFKEVCNSPHLRCESEPLSKLVALYLRSHSNAGSDGKDDVSEEFFYWMTQSKIMPRISPEEALFYLTLSERFPEVLTERGEESLGSRCIIACSNSWLSTVLGQIAYCGTTQKEGVSTFEESYEKLPANIKIEVLESSLLCAKRELEIAKNEKKSEKVGKNDVQLSEKLSLKSVIAKSRERKVAVFGSGIAPLNGIFVDSGNGYEKEAYWNGERVTFILHEETASRYYWQFKISVESCGRITSLYNSPTRAGQNATIPETGWQVEGGGVHPPPGFVGTLEQSH